MYVDRLEARTLLSSSLSGGTLSVVGTGGNDRTFIYRASATTLIVDENGVNTSYAIASVAKINTDSKAGNDLLEVSKSLLIPTSLSGNTGNDTLTGGGGKDTIVGGSGNDLLSDSIGGAVLRGGDGNDTLRGGTGVDALLGEGGDDNLEGGAEANFLDGGAGYDTVDYSARNVGVSVVLDWDILDSNGDRLFRDSLVANLVTSGTGGSLADNVLDKFAFVESVSGSSGDDIMRIRQLSEQVGGENLPSDLQGFDTLPTLGLSGNGGDDSIGANYIYDSQFKLKFTGSGQSGDDFFSADDAGLASLVTFYGGSGSDNARASEEDRFVFYGEDGNDSAEVDSSAESGDITFFGGAGIDTLSRNYFNRDLVMPNDLENINPYRGTNGFKIIGNALDNTLFLSEDADVAYADLGAGNDSVKTSRADFVQLGGTLITGEGNDTVYGSFKSIDTGAGNDVVNLVTGGPTESTSTIVLGSGNDKFTTTVNSNYAGNGVVTRVVVRGGDGSDNISSGSTLDTLYGDAGNDTIDGGAGNDVLQGNGGADFLSGGGGVDALFGGIQNDVLNGGTGDDYLDGGENDDILTGGTGRDRLNGFGGNDTLYSLDSEVDTLDGGSGTDRAQRDNSSSVKDSVLSIESFI